MLTVPRTTAAIAQLEQLHTLITLDEAVQILSGKKPSLSNRVRKGVVRMCCDINLAVRPSK